MKVLLLLALSFTLSYAQNSNTICNGRKEGLMIPKSGDCTKFYHCSHNVGYLKDCPSGLHFNNRLQVCDWPDKAGCSGGSGGSGGCGCEEPTTCTPPTECTTTTCAPTTECPTTTCAPTTECPTTTCATTTECTTTTCRPTTECPTTTCAPITWTTPCVTPPPPCDTTTCGSGGSGGNPAGCPNGQYSAYPGNPGKFIVCDHGISTTMDCPSGLQFNTKLNVCDWPK